MYDVIDDLIIQGSNGPLARERLHERDRRTPGRRPAGAVGAVAERRGTGVLAVGGAVDDLASLVDRSAATARLGPGDGGVPGAGPAFREPRSDHADELACRAHQCVAVAAVAPVQGLGG